MIKMIAIDLDGTLLNSNKLVSSENIRVLKEKESQGISIVLASGRPHSFVRAVAHEIGLRNNTFYISCNGAYIHNLSSAKPYKEFLLKKDDYSYIFDSIRHLDIDIFALTEDFIHSHHSVISHGAITESHDTKIGIHSLPISDLNRNTKVSKICLFGNQLYLDSLKDKIPPTLSEKYNIMRSAKDFIDIISKQSSKGHAVKILADNLRLKKENLMCIGDNENDISMLSFSGIGIAMGNATERLKSIANFITTSNDEDGVAKAILAHT